MEERFHPENGSVKMDPQEVVKLAVHRDPDAFSHLYNLYYPEIYRYALYKVGDQISAEDLTATVFAKAWEGIGRFKWQDRPFKHWLLRIAHNSAIDHWRANRHPMSPMEALDTVESNDPSPFELMERDIEIEEIAKAIGSLTDNQRDVLVLHFIKQYTYVEIADVLGKSEVAVKKIQVRGLRLLRKIMKSE